MAQQLQQPPKPDVGIVYNADQTLDRAALLNEMSTHLLKQMEERISSHEAHQDKLKELEELMRGVIKNHSDLLQSLEHYKQAKHDDLETHKKLELSLFDVQTNLKRHESETLANTTAMLGHTEGIKNLIAELTT